MIEKCKDHNSAGSFADSEEGWAGFFQVNGLCEKTYHQFKAVVYKYYSERRRSFEWRDDMTPYRVFVSEVMLQQTQTIRVADKFSPFVETFPDFTSLARASFSEVLRLWKGLGYNRRAKYLQDAAAMIVEEYNAQLPEDPEILINLPGIGPATAASITVFAFNRPLPFIETNIRTVFIHFFFPGEAKVHDTKIMSLVEKTLDHKCPREWYYALMDYGVMLKKTVGNVSRRSSHYSKQSRFEGSDRQVRGKMLQLLLDRQILYKEDLAGLLDEPQERCMRILEALCREGIIQKEENRLKLS